MLILALKDTGPGISKNPESQTPLEDTNPSSCFPSLSQANFSKAVAERAGEGQGGWRRDGGRNTEGKTLASSSPSNTSTSLLELATAPVKNN